QEDATPGANRSERAWKLSDTERLLARRQPIGPASVRRPEIVLQIVVASVVHQSLRRDVVGRRGSCDQFEGYAHRVDALAGPHEVLAGRVAAQVAQRHHVEAGEVLLRRVVGQVAEQARAIGNEAALLITRPAISFQEGMAFEAKPDSALARFL